MAALLLSTSPAASPISCTAAKSRSVSSIDAFFGHAIQSPSAGASVFFSAPKRRLSSARLVVKKTTTSAPGFAPSFFASGVVYVFSGKPLEDAVDRLGSEVERLGRDALV